MSFIGALKFYTKFLEKLHINFKPFYDLLHESTPWKLTDETRNSFSKTQNVSHLWNRTYHPKYKTSIFHYSRRFAYLIRRCSFPIERRKLNESYILQLSYIEPTRTQTFYAQSRTSRVHALQIYEFPIIGFPHPIHVFTDHKPLLHCFTKTVTLVHAFTELKCN